MMSCINTPDIVPNADIHGQIQVIYGPMFSGKTTELIRRMKRFQLANYDCLVIKYSHDERYSKESVATHDRQTLPAVSATQLLPLISTALNSDVIGVDEGQFFPDIVKFCENLADRGKTVIVAALDGDFQRQVEVIGGTEKYLAVCRQCHKPPAKLSPRPGPQNQTPCNKPVAASGRQLFGVALSEMDVNVMDQDH